MSDRVTRNAVVALLGTPDRTVGSVNSPVELEEFGHHYNECWIYEHLVGDPAGVPMRVIYWHRYDFVATMVRAGAGEQWRDDPTLAAALAGKSDRLSPIENRHEPVKASGLYQPASEVKDSSDLGGYIMGRKS